MKNYILILVLCLAIFSCSEESKFVDYDLVQHGLTIKIKAPLDPDVKVTDMGIAKDVTIAKGEDYNVQIISSNATTYDVKKILADKKADIEKIPFFSKIVHEDEHGFVFEKKIDDENINYDFRSVKIIGDQEYDFQTGLLGKFTKEQAMDMFEAVK